MRTVATAMLSIGLLVSLSLSFAAADDPPGLLHSTLLNGVNMHHETGELSLRDMQALALPKVESDQSIYGYNPDSGGKLWAILTDRDDGTELARYDFYANPRGELLWHLNSYRLTDLRTNEQSSMGRVKLGPGEYVLDFHLQSGRFYTYPFTVSTVGDNGFSFLDGDWNDWGYLYYADADPANSIQWKIWLRHKGTEASKNVKIRIGVMRESENNKLVATNRPNMSFDLRPEWNRFEFDLIEPMQGTAGGRQLSAQDIVGVDGTYVLKMVVDEQDYGIWRFEVKDGKPQPAGRTVRGEADPLTFVEGGADAFWYGRAE
jgi:hypothetical protein